MLQQCDGSKELAHHETFIFNAKFEGNGSLALAEGLYNVCVCA